jgi:CRISPR-associated endonuclease/helicase Cas3
MRAKKPNSVFDRLLAKSATGNALRDQHTLQGHTGMVVAAAHQLLRARGLASLRAVGLPASAIDRLSRIVLLGAFAHDLGKCSAHFQEVVRSVNRRQLVRHEAATLWLAWPGQPLGPWLAQAVGSDEDLMLALCAAAGHHRKFWSQAIASDEDDAGSEMALLSDHPDFRRLLEGAGRITGLVFAAPPEVERITIVAGRESPQTRLGEWHDECRTVVRDNAALLAAAKALVLCADVAGSALPKSGEHLNWIEEALANRADSVAFTRVVTERLGANTLRPFQRQVAAARAPVTLVVAGCGSGKTLAAYQWAAEQHAGRQLWVTYPTTGTATEGYRDYVADPDLQIDARLEHSRALVDLEILSPAPEDACEVRRDRDRLDALRSWQSMLVTSTADTVLGVVQNQRKGLYAWAGLAHSAVVFDEVHAYDDQMFGTLLRFLHDVPGIPVLLMTASLPASRRAKLEQLVLETHGRSLEVVRGPGDLEQIPRYTRRVAHEHWTDIEDYVSQGRKVLFVSNTVERCKANAAKANSRGLACTVYHSRFRYEDRVQRHKRVIDGFRNEGAALAVTTQVAEMSLDLSADLLVTELASVPALIQRLGRLNRRATPVDRRSPMPFIILNPPSHLPYSQEELQRAEVWLEKLGAGPLSQADLVAAWEDDDRDVVNVASAWFDGGFSTELGQVREDGYGIHILLESDARAVEAKTKLATAAALPMPPPKDKAWVRWRRVDGYVVPPTGTVHYDSTLGAEWA